MQKSFLTFFCCLVLLSGCKKQSASQAQPTQPPVQQPQVTVMTDHNMMSHPQINDERDFLLNMIPHHVEAVDTSQLVMNSTQNEELQIFAESVVASQSEEINQMIGWLKEWFGEEYIPNNAYAPMMGDLSTVQGEQLDRKYIEGMIAHHQSAIQMAQQALELNPRQEIKDLANAIITVQQDEVATLQSWLQ